MAAGRKKATRKKTTVKKAARKKAPAKKAARKKAARKKATAKKATRKKAAPKKSARAKATAKQPGRRALVETPAVSKASGGEPAKSSAPPAVSAEQPEGAKLAASVPTRIGVITHYFARAGAAVILLESGELRVGDTIHVRGHTTDFYQRVGRIEIEHASVEVATPGQSVGVEVSQRVREHDEVFRVSEPG